MMWDAVGDHQLFGLDLIKDFEEKVKLIRDRLKVAQSRRKSYADTKRKEVVFEIGDTVYLRVSPLRGVKRFGVKGKLAPRFVGPYRVLERMGEVAYKLELPEGLSGVYDVFHVSQLKKCHAEMADIPLRDTLPLEAIQLDSDLPYEEKPVKVLEFASRVTRSKVIKFCKFRGATIPRMKQPESKKKTYGKTTNTYFLANPNLEGAIHLKGGRFVTSQIFNLECYK